MGDANRTESQKELCVIKMRTEKRLIRGIRYNDGDQESVGACLQKEGKIGEGNMLTGRREKREIV